MRTARPRQSAFSAGDSQRAREPRVASRPVDVDVPRKSADDREHGRADDVADIGGVWTRVMKRRVLDESVEETTRLQIGNEVRQPSPLRDLRFRMPADVELASNLCSVEARFTGLTENCYTTKNHKKVLA